MVFDFHFKWNRSVPVPPCRDRLPMAQRNSGVLFFSILTRSWQRLPDFDVRTCITSRLRGYETPASERANECVSERALGYVRKSILRKRGTLSGRPPACGTVRRGSKKKSVHLLRETGKKRPGRAARGGYVTRRKKGGRAKREAVNLGLLLGNRNSF